MFTCNIANIYAPNSKSDKLIFFNELAEMCTEDCDDDLLMFGDFNCVLDNSSDIVSGKPHGSVEVNAFNNMLNKMELCDVWRSFHENEKDFTWNRTNPFIARRLDYCLASVNILPNCVNCV